VLVAAVVWLVTVVGETGNPAEGRALASHRA